SIYDTLVRANPADPTLRVNLGLVFLKTNFLVRAIREFQTAINLAPDHKKAHNYLGLAFAQAGEYARARDHFLAAGSEAMAEKMAQAAVSYSGDGSTPPVAQDPAIDSLGGADAQTAMPYVEQTPPEAMAYEPAPTEMSGVGSADWAAQIAEEEAMARTV